jgi:hypothetical protein
LEVPEQSPSSLPLNPTLTVTIAIPVCERKNNRTVIGQGNSLSCIGLLHSKTEENHKLAADEIQFNEN